MKKYFAVTLILFISLCLFTVSCKSVTGVRIPGEEKIRIENITAEYFQIAKAYQDLKNYNKAVEYYQLAMNDKKFYDSSLYQIGICYVQQKDWINAEDIFQKLLSKDKENLTLQASIAFIKANSGKLEEAAELYREICEKNPSDVVYLKNYISVLIAAENLKAAEREFARLKENFPDDEAITSIETKIADLSDKLSKPEETDTEDSEKE